MYRKHIGRRLARLRAVQALYQMDIAADSLGDIIAQFRSHHLGAQADAHLPASDADYFETLLRGVVAYQSKIDPAIASALRDNWRLARLDSTLRAILRCGCYEILYADISPRMVCDEYTTIAHSFFDGEEGGMTNALLQRLAEDKHDATATKRV